MHHLSKRVQAHYAGSEAERDWPIRNLTWDYPEHGDEPRARRRGRAAARSTATTSTTGEPVPGFAELKADGSTACGCWIYSGVYADGVNQARRREPGRPRRARRLGLARVGVGVAGQPPHALQPRLAPTRRASRGRSASATSGGTRTRRSGRATTCPTSRSTSAPDYAARRRRRGHGRDRRRRPVHHDGRRPGWLYSPARPARRADADALRADRVAGRRTCSTPRSAATRRRCAGTRPDNPYAPDRATRATRTWRRPSGSPSTTPRAR